MAEPRGTPFNLTTLITGLALVYAATVVWTNVLPTRGMVAATEERLEQLERENLAHETMIETTERHCEMLEKDPWTIERVLRDEFKMTREGEVVLPR